VTDQTIQFVVSGFLSACLAIYVYCLASRHLLSFRYTIGWLALSGVGIFAGFFIPILGPVSQTIKVTPAAIIAVGALVVLLLICIQLSIAISTLQEQSRTLAEQIAHLQLELRREETQSMDTNKDAE
jgi:hypothetical protein